MLEIFLVGGLLSGILIVVIGLVIRIHDDPTYENRIMTILLVALALNLMVLIAYIALVFIIWC